MFNPYSDLSEVDQLTHDDIINMWCEDLEQYPELQGTGYLDKNGKRCCLGQLCHIASLYGVCKTKPSNYNGSVYYNNANMYPPGSVQLWAKLYSNNGSYYDANGEIRYLSNDNDFGTDWPAIAKTIRSRPEGLFTV